MRPLSRRNNRTSVVLAFLLATLAPGASAEQATVAPSFEQVGAATQAQLVERWWQWANRVPPGVRPYQDPSGAQCGLNQSGDVWFLAGTDGTADINRRCKLTSDKYVFFPVIAMLGSSRPGTTLTCAQAIARAMANNGHLAHAEVLIDGEAVPQLASHRIGTPHCFDAYPVAPYLSGAKSYFPAATDGYWLLLRPLPPGEHHVRVRARYDNPGNELGNLEQVFDYDLQVELPAPAAPKADHHPDYI